MPPAAQAQDQVLKVGTLKLIHGITAYFYEKFAPAGYKVEVIPFESPTDGKNAVLTGTVDTCIYGIAAFLLGAAAGEPVVIVANANNRGMAVIAGAKTGIKTDQGPEGQEGRDLAGLDAGGGDPRAAADGRHDDQGHPADPPAVQRHAGGARARRRRRLCRRRAGGPASASPTAPACWSSIPYSTPIGSLNMILSAQREARSRRIPARVQDGRRHAPQGGRLRDGEPRADRRDGGAEARPAAARRSRSRRPTSSSPGRSTTCSCSAPRPTRG